MKRMLITLMLLLALLVVTVSMGAAAQNKPEIKANREVIILAEGNTDELVNFIQSVGGTVKFQYANVPAVAASVPASQFEAVAGFPGVLEIEKDGMVSLDEGLDEGKNGAHPRSFVAESVAGVEVRALDVASMDLAALPEGYANFLYTGAIDAWADTYAGEGSVVAIVDTGTVPNTCIGHAVIGAPGFPDGYNATGDGVLATDPSNHWHGTHVGGVVASDCALDFSAAPTHNIYLAQEPYLGWPIDFVPILGQAPGASLYPVKVFRADGGASPTSVILDGLDHVLTLKLEGLLDVDIVNMSLGGPTVWDGRDAFDRFVETLQSADILVVTSASNDGPRPNSMGSPGTSLAAISVGALDYAPSSRTFYEYLGLRDMSMIGQGMIMRPTAETRVVNFSSRGPLSDGRMGPEITALGHWTFHEGPVGELRWAGGTSFSSPTVAGGAALLNAYWEGLGYETDPVALEDVLLLGADPAAVGPTWQGVNDQGYGALDIPASLDILMSGDWKTVNQKQKVGELDANILGNPVPGKTKTWKSKTVTLNPSEPYNLVFEIGQYTSKVTIEVFNIQTPDNSTYAYWPNALEVHLESGKRTSTGDATVLVYWYPFAYGNAFDIVVEDGPWTFWDIPWADQPMEPGLMRLSLIGDYSNESPVSFKVRVTREDKRQPLANPIASGVIKGGDFFVVPVEIPEGTSQAVFDLTWHRDWTMFPTSDIDMVIYGPDFSPASVDGATINVPERATLVDPAPGTYYVYFEAYEMYKPDNYNLYMTLK